MGRAEMLGTGGRPSPAGSVPPRRAGRPPWADGRFIDVAAGRFPATGGGIGRRASQTWPNHGDRYDAPNRTGSGGDRRSFVFHRFESKGFSSNRDWARTIAHSSGKVWNEWIARVLARASMRR
jgi:hypothetical protein